MLSDDLLKAVSLPLSDGERIIHVSRWSKAGMIAQMLLVALPLAVVALVLIVEGGSVLGVGVLFAFFALAAYAVADQSWNKRRAILTTKIENARAARVSRGMEAPSPQTAQTCS